MRMKQKWMGWVNAHFYHSNIKMSNAFRMILLLVLTRIKFTCTPKPLNMRRNLEIEFLELHKCSNIKILTLSNRKYRAKIDVKINLRYVISFSLRKVRLYIWKLIHNCTIRAVFFTWQGNMRAEMLWIYIFIYLYVPLTGYYMHVV